MRPAYLTLQYLLQIGWSQGWFSAEICTDDDVEKLTALKFRGDLAFRRQQYQKALCEYTSSLALVPETNIGLRRDLLEARARCLCFLSREEEALEIAQELRLEVTNTDHLTALLNLLILIYQSAGCLTKELSCLQELVSLHPFNPWSWKKLAATYLRLVQGISSPVGLTVLTHKNVLCTKQKSIGVTSTETEISKASSQGCTRSKLLSESHIGQRDCASLLEEENGNLAADCRKRPQGAENSSCFLSGGADHVECSSETRVNLDDLWLFTCSSLVRARLLLQMVKPQQSSFVLERNLNAQEEIAQEVFNLGLREEALSALTEVMGDDLSMDRFKNDDAENERLAALPNSSMTTGAIMESYPDFEERWFTKLKSLNLLLFQPKTKADIPEKKLGRET
ncbi:zinc fingers and homeoboxes protein 1 isoform X2 [Callorhinchus milii]|uniref:zinc fingers and homeoboxes protein 1 isoform X2 n=1 Tax=Callorhinchus milii TaxID=7868 RepID=UPI001C3F66F7|nr:zinc fingers and homeoboxes protein 1 isoform X2 [Callorhinchus milii]